MPKVILAPTVRPVLPVPLDLLVQPGLQARLAKLAKRALPGQPGREGQQGRPDPRARASTWATPARQSA